MDELVQIAERFAIILGGLGIGIGGVGYLVRSFRQGGDQIEDRVISLTKEENAALERKLEQMEKELRAANEANKFLEGRVAELSQSNAQLAALVVGEQVPKALEMALTGIANRVIERVEQTENALSQGMLTIADAIQQVLARAQIDPEKS